MRYIGLIIAFLIISVIIFSYIKNKQNTPFQVNPKQKEKISNEDKELLKQKLSKLLEKRLEREQELALLKEIEQIQKKEKEEWEKNNSIEKDKAEKKGDADRFHKLLMEQVALSDALQKTQEDIGNTYSKISFISTKISAIESQLN